MAQLGGLTLGGARAEGRCRSVGFHSHDRTKVKARPELKTYAIAAYPLRFKKKKTSKPVWVLRTAFGLAGEDKEGRGQRREPRQMDAVRCDQGRHVYVVAAVLLDLRVRGSSRGAVA